MCSRKVSTICTTSLRPRGMPARVAVRPRWPAFSQAGAGVAPAACIGAHVGRAAEAGDAVRRGGRGVALQVDLQRRADEHVAGVRPAAWQNARLERSEPSAPVKNTSGRARDVVLHAELRSRTNGSICTQPASIAGISAGCGLSAQWLADLALQAKRSPHRSAAAARSPRCRSRCRGSGAARRTRRRCP